MKSSEMCRRAGITYRQLDHWTRSGYLTPAFPANGSGSHRSFSFEDAIVATVLKDYLAHHSSRKKVNLLFQGWIRSALRERKPKIRLGTKTSIVTVVVNLDAARLRVLSA